jgi:hypothetical protein
LAATNRRFSLSAELAIDSVGVEAASVEEIL